MNTTVDYAFLHGGGQGSWVWAETIAALRLQDHAQLHASQRQTTPGIGKVLALDIPGCGLKRHRVTDEIDVDDIVSELISDIEGANLRDVILIGHSQAGNVMPALAAARPDLFRQLVYLSCSIPLPGQSVIELMGKGLHGSNDNEVGWPNDPTKGSLQERYPLMFCNDMSPEQTAALMAKLGADAWPMKSYDYRDWQFNNRSENAASVGVPASYIVCLRDGILPVAWQEKFAQRFFAEDIIQLDAGHQAMNSRPHTLAEILRHQTK